jgi:deoxyuridine 5'-triphosphate nucleotidohydrolase
MSLLQPENWGISTTLRVEKIDPAAYDLIQADEGAAGLDICALTNAVVPPRGRTLIHTGLKVVCAKNYYVRVAPRSGLALKKGIDVGGGVIDSSYRGEVGVILFNHSDEEFEVKSGDKVAQLIVEVIPANVKIKYGQILDQTVRGSGGFGSSGV